MKSVVETIDEKFLDHIRNTPGFNTFTVGYIFLDKTLSRKLANELYLDFGPPPHEMEDMLLSNSCRYKMYNLLFVENLLEGVEVFSR